MIFALVFNNFWRNGIIFGDSFVLFAPHKFLIAEALKSGKIYAWAPWQYMGIPFVADILAGWFYPLNLIYLALPLEAAHRLFILLHYPLAAIFMDLLLRRWGIDKYSSLVGALAFALSGYMICQHKNMIFLIGPAWAPLAIYFMDRSVRESILWSFGLGAVLVFQIFAGEPQSAGITASIALCIGLFTALKPKRRRVALVSLVLAATTSMFLSFMQLLPTFELLRLSTRLGGVPLTRSTIFSFHPGRIIELIWPAPFGRMWPDGLYWAEFIFSNTLENNPWSFTNYLGLPIIVLAAVGVIYSRRPFKTYVGAGMVLFFLLALGEYTPFYPLIHRIVPIFDFFRYPAKYMAWFSGFCAVAAALGIEQLQFWLRGKAAALTGAAMIYMAVIIVMAIIAVFVWPVVISGVTGLAEPAAEYELIKSHIIKGGRQWLIVNLAVGLTLLFMSRKLLSIKMAVVVFCSVLIADYYLTNVSMMGAGAPDIYNFPSISAKVIRSDAKPQLGHYRIFRKKTDFHDTNPAYKDYYYIERFAIWQRNSLTHNLHAMEGFEKIFGYNAIIFNEDRNVFQRGDLKKKLELYNVNYVVSTYFGSEPIKGAGTEVIYSNPRSDLTITRLNDSWPRVYWVPSATAASDGHEAAIKLNSADLKKTVIITTGENIDTVDAGDREMVPAGVTVYEPDRVQVENDMDAAGWLVLSDRYYPGWNATVDGKPVKIYKANVLIRAIPLEAGKHTINFIYRPTTLRIGLAVSITSCITLIGIGLAAAGFKRKSKANS